MIGVSQAMPVQPTKHEHVMVELRSLHRPFAHVVPVHGEFLFSQRVPVKSVAHAHWKNGNCEDWRQVPELKQGLMSQAVLRSQLVSV